MEKTVRIYNFVGVKSRYLDLRAKYCEARNEYAEVKAAAYQEHDIEMIVAETKYRKAQMEFMQYMRSQLNTILLSVD